MGLHWIQGTIAETAMEIFSVIMRNQTKALVFSVVKRRRDTAKATLVRDMAVMVTVARESRVRKNRVGSVMFRS